MFISHFKLIFVYTVDSVRTSISKINVKLIRFNNKRMSFDLLSKSWVHNNCPGFNVRGDNIEIINSPESFYQTFLRKISSANNRITIASLYIGTGSLERELVKAIDKRMCEKPHLKVLILLDRLRGTRGHPNSLTLLLPLLEKYKSRIELRLYTTPLLKGYLLRLPQRLNESLGVQHIKAYIFDDDIIISGCNLAHMYFTDRQDRYLILRNAPNLVQFVDDVVKTICIFSERVKGNLGPVSKENAKLSSYLGPAINKLISNAMTESNEFKNDTIIFPTLQLYQHGITHDLTATLDLLTNTQLADTLYISSGYFNMPQLFTDTILTSKARYRILAASERANGFYAANGISRHIPTMYMQHSNLFLEQISSCNDRIKYYESMRENWSFHAKGVWYYNDDADLPCLTLIGSPNYGYRSVWRDTELQFFIQTANLSLQRKFDAECKRLYNLAMTNEVRSDCIKTRPVARYMKFATRILRSFL